jgi:hypothetical protein
MGHMRKDASEHDPTRGYRTHEDALDAPTPAEQAAETQPDAQDRRDNQFGDASGETRTQWDPDAELDLTPERSPGLATGIGLPGGPKGVISFAELRRRARKKRNQEEYAAGVKDEYERAVEEAENETPIEDIEPVDAT